MSFSLTKKQFLAGTETVTRRLGWKCLVGDEWKSVMAVNKCMGLKKGEKIQKYGEIKARGRMERLCDITKSEVVKEGFPDMATKQFVAFFCKNMKKRFLSNVMLDG